MPQRAGNFHAKLVQRQGQRTALTFATAPQISWTLHRLYPLLLICDGILSNILWCCDDVCLPFIHSVLLVLSTNILTVQDGASFARRAVESWVGTMSCVLLLLSFVYYISSVLHELNADEPPTLEDIIVMVETVVYKLEVIRDDLREPLKMSSQELVTVLVFITPVHWLLMKYLFSSNDYLVFLVLFCSVYHSSWCQCTLRLLWRSLYVRQLLSLVCGRTRDAGGIGQAAFYVVNNSGIQVPRYTSPLEDLSSSSFSNRVRKALDGVYDPDLVSKHSSTPVSAKVVEFRIDENQRKWPLDGWTQNMLPYERSKFTASQDPASAECSSPWKFQESLGREWCWLDDAWKPEPWLYCDTHWIARGENDSLDCYTRRRMWKRRAFQCSH
ncbi:Pex24p domain-containing protein [Lachancea thermotolerans]